jgi:hypothetical protein
MVKGNSFLSKMIFFNLLCDNSNVSYREKRETPWPVSRRVKSAETLAVFPNFVRVLYVYFLNYFAIGESETRSARGKLPFLTFWHCISMNHLTTLLCVHYHHSYLF